VVAGIQRFEDITAWRKARILTKDIYYLTRQGAFARDFGLTGQLQRASVAIISNIAEGFERHRHGELHQFLSIAKGSCAEVRSLLYVAHDAAYIDTPAFDQLMAQAEEVGRLVGAFRSSIEKRRDRGR
jgi:four helix bundle protein